MKNGFRCNGFTISKRRDGAVDVYDGQQFVCCFGGTDAACAWAREHDRAKGWPDY